MPVAQRRDDPRWLIFKVYDHHQPSTWSLIELEEPFTIRPAIGFAVVRRADCVEDDDQMRLKLGVTVPRVQDMPKPGVLKEDNTYAIRRLGLGEYGALSGSAQSVAEGIR